MALVAGALALLALAGAVTLSAGAQGAGSPTSIGPWTVATPAPLQRAEAQGAVVGGKLYVLGGYKQGNPCCVATRRSDAYDPATDTWDRLKDAPTFITHAGTAAYEGDIYLAGGVVGQATAERAGATREVWRYDVAADSWYAFEPLPAPRGAGAMVRLGETLHYFAGTNTDRSDSVGTHWVIRPDGTNPTWRRAAPVPNPRNHLGGAVVRLEGKIYAIGGQHGHNADRIYQNEVHKWDPATDEWTEVAPLPRASSHFTAATLVRNDRIIVVGGAPTSANVTEYNPATDEWTELRPLPAPRHSSVAGIIGDVIVVATGSTDRYTRSTLEGVLQE